MTDNEHIVLASIPRSYAQVFFSNYSFLGWLLLGISFIDWVAGTCGLIAVVVANTIAWLLGYSSEMINQGMYGFNALLVGLGTGLGFQPGWELFSITIFAAVFTLFLTLALEGILYKYNLPYLSLPFMFGMWMVMLASRDFQSLGLSERGIYTANELFTLGGKPLVDLYYSISHIDWPPALRTYLLSLGAIFFQTNLLAGILIAAGLLLFSRIAFTLSVLGFSIAWGFYQLTGASIHELTYTYIGFNYILTAIAIGGIFLVPSFKSYLWTAILLPVVVMLTLSLGKVFLSFGLSVYSLPFNIVVITFVYVLKLRLEPGRGPVEVTLQENSPERNLYHYIGTKQRFAGRFYLPVSLPFFGEWTVSQGHSGEYTHKDEWKHAWDFVITDEEGKQYKGGGDWVTDYFCFGKAVASPGDGTVAELVDGVPDNKIGDVNTHQNWGNTVVIKHSDYLYSKLSHLKEGSIKVKKGEFVKQGQTIGEAGNSGRSPYPHLHMQFQVLPNIGAPTLSYPFGQYILNNGNAKELKSFAIPRKDEKIASIRKTKLIEEAMHFIPGEHLQFRILKNEIPAFRRLPEKAEWIVDTTSRNESRLISETEQATAWIYNDGQVHYFSHFQGKNKSLLYLFFLGLFKVQSGFYADLEIQDSIPANLVFPKSWMFLHDFTAPFFRFLHADFSLQYSYIDNPTMPGQIELTSIVEKKVFNRQLSRMTFKTEIGPTGIKKITVEENDKILIALCEEPS